MTDSDVRRIEDKVDNLAIGFARLEGSLAPTLDKLTNRQDETDKRFDKFEEDTGKRFDDFEVRVRAGERFRYAVPSAAFLSLLVSVGVLAYYLLGGH